jgi:hypothetical protein
MTLPIRALGTKCYECSNRSPLRWPTLQAVSFTKNRHVRTYKKKNAYIVLLERTDEKMSLGICGRIILKCNLEWWYWKV